MYAEYRNRLDTENGEDLSFLGEIYGIRCYYEDEKGVRVKVSLDDESGAKGYAKVDSQKYSDEYRKLFGEAKKLASSILEL